MILSLLFNTRQTCLLKILFSIKYKTMLSITERFISQLFLGSSLLILATNVTAQKGMPAKPVVTVSHTTNFAQHIDFEPSEDMIPVYADKIRIFEVISNFLTNVIKFSNGKSITNSINRVQRNDIDSKHILVDNREVKVVDIKENPEEAMKTMMIAVISKGIEERE